MIVTAPLFQNIHTEAGYEQVALIRAELFSLSEYLTSVVSHDTVMVTLNEKVKACHDKFHVAFKKLGDEEKIRERQAKEICELKQQNEKLKQENDELIAKLSSGTSKFARDQFCIVIIIFYA